MVKAETLLIMMMMSFFLGAVGNHLGAQKELVSCKKDLTYELLSDNINYDCTTDRECMMVDKVNDYE